MTDMEEEGLSLEQILSSIARQVDNLLRQGRKKFDEFFPSEEEKDALLIGILTHGELLLPKGKSLEEKEKRAMFNALCKSLFLSNGEKERIEALFFKLGLEERVAALSAD